MISLRILQINLTKNYFNIWICLNYLYKYQPNLQIFTWTVLESHWEFSRSHWKNVIKKRYKQTGKVSLRTFYISPQQPRPPQQIFPPFFPKFSLLPIIWIIFIFSLRYKSSTDLSWTQNSNFSCISFCFSYVSFSFSSVFSSSYFR